MSGTPLHCYRLFDKYVGVEIEGMMVERLLWFVVPTVGFGRGTGNKNNFLYEVEQQRFTQTHYSEGFVACACRGRRFFFDFLDKLDSLWNSAHQLRHTNVSLTAGLKRSSNKTPRQEVPRNTGYTSLTRGKTRVQSDVLPF